MPFTFSPPGYLDDLSAAAEAAWHEWMSSQMDLVQAGHPERNDGPRTQFFNPARVAPDDDAVTEDISWSAFPRQIQISSVGDVQRWRRADASRQVQDEYCEWSVTRASDGRITQVDFTCEGPEYWAFLAATDPQKTLDLYRAHVGQHVQMTDLYRNGSYDPHNRWNVSATDGCMHLIQPSNSLHAEIELAGGASIVRLNPDGSPKTSAAELIRCGAYGAPERHSDPHIGDRVNALARARADITLADPVGLYLDSDGLDLSQWALPDGSAPDTLVTYTRGSPGHWLRMVVKAPTDADFLLADVTINGRTIDYGAQIVDCMRVKLTGLATRLGRSQGNPVTGCVGASTSGIELASVPSVESAIESALGQRGGR